MNKLSKIEFSDFLNSIIFYYSFKRSLFNNIEHAKLLCSNFVNYKLKRTLLFGLTDNISNYKDNTNNKR